MAAERQHQLLRYSHIFASVVHDILERKYLEEVSPGQLTLSQFHLLKILSLNGGHQVGQVANLLGVSPPAATKTIDKLEGLGLIARSPFEGDRRATLLLASVKGRRLVRKYERLKEVRLNSVLEAFTPQEMELLSHLLERFSVCTLRQEDPTTGLCMRCAAYCEEDCGVSRLRGGCPYMATQGSQVGARVGEGIS